MHPRCRRSTAAYMDDEEYREWLGILSMGWILKLGNLQRESVKDIRIMRKTLQFLMEGLPKWANM